MEEKCKSIKNNQPVMILNESFHEFSLNCIYREMISETGQTGRHNCSNVLKKTLCDKEVCPRINLGL